VTSAVSYRDGLYFRSVGGGDLETADQGPLVQVPEGHRPLVITWTRRFELYGGDLVPKCDDSSTHVIQIPNLVDAAVPGPRPAIFSNNEEFLARRAEGE